MSVAWRPASQRGRPFLGRLCRGRTAPPPSDEPRQRRAKKKKPKECPEASQTGTKHTDLKCGMRAAPAAVVSSAAQDNRKP